MNRNRSNLVKSINNSRHIRPSSLLRVDDDSIGIGIDHHLHDGFSICDFGGSGAPDDSDGPVGVDLEEGETGSDTGAGGYEDEGFEL